MSWLRYARMLMPLILQAIDVAKRLSDDKPMQRRFLREWLSIVNEMGTAALTELEDRIDDAEEDTWRNFILCVVLIFKGEWRYAIAGAASRGRFPRCHTISLLPPFYTESYGLFAAFGADNLSRPPQRRNHFTNTYSYS